MRRPMLVFVAVLAMGLVACSSNDDGGASASPSGGGTADCPDLTSGDTFTITIEGLAFQPDCFTARAAQGITIVNKDSVPHTFTIDGTQIDVEIAGGETFNGEPASEVVAPGTYDFRCTIHPQMTGTITVE